MVIKNTKLYSPPVLIKTNQAKVNEGKMAQKHHQANGDWDKHPKKY